MLREITGVGMPGMPPSPIFFISPKGGDLAPGESVTLRVTFSPQDNKDYEARIPLFLADQVSARLPAIGLAWK